MGGKSHPVQQSSPSISFQAAIYHFISTINTALYKVSTWHSVCTILHLS